MAANGVESPAETREWPRPVLFNVAYRSDKGQCPRFSSVAIGFGTIASPQRPTTAKRWRVS